MNYLQKHRAEILQLQRDLIQFQTYTATKHAENGWESDEVESIQNVIDIIDNELK